MKGFTLIESLVVIAILGIVSGLFTTVLTEGNVAYLFLARENLMAQEGRVAMNWMVQDLTNELLVGPYHSFNISNRPYMNYMNFTRNSDGQAVIYSWPVSPDPQPLTRSLGGTSRTLATNVTSLIFTYLDATETAIVGSPLATADLPRIVSIRISITFQVGNGTLTLTSVVRPRNTDIPGVADGGV